LFSTLTPCPKKRLHYICSPDDEMTDIKTTASHNLLINEFSLIKTWYYNTHFHLFHRKTEESIDNKKTNIKFTASRNLLYSYRISSTIFKKPGGD